MNMTNIRSARGGVMLRAGLAGLVFFQAIPASAETIEDAPDILVIGQQEAPLTVVPRGLSVSLDQEHFDAVNALNVEDLMKYAPNFFVRKRFAGDDNAVVALRGANTIQSARTIIMVDGFVVSNFLGNRWDFPPKWNVVGPAEVRQFDIVYGPYSARYGGNSLGGVISVTTKATEENSFYLNAQTMLMPFQEYGFNETFSGYSVEGGLNWQQRDGPWSLRLSARHFENVGQSMTYMLLSPTSGSGPLVTGAFEDSRLPSPVFGAASPVDVRQDQARIRLGYAAENGWQADILAMLWLTAQDLTRPVSWLRSSVTGAPVTQGKVRFAEQTWNATGLNFSTMRRAEYLAGLKLSGPISGWDAQINLSHYGIPNWDSRTSKDYAAGASGGQGTQSLMDNPGWWTMDASFEKQWGAHHVAMGASGNLYETAGNSFSTSQWKDASAPAFMSSTYGKTRLWGLWLEDEIRLANGWLLTAGLRHERWRAFDGGMGKWLAGARRDARYPVRRSQSWSPKVSVQRDLGDKLALQISLGTAQRFPTVGELFQGRFDDVTQEIDPQSFDPNLKAEKSRDANIILRYRQGRSRLTASLFYQDIRDAIFSFSGLNSFGTVTTSYKNVDRVRQFGAELIFELRDALLEGLNFDANLAWTDARTLRNSANRAAEGVQFPRIPRWRTNGTLRYRLAAPVHAALGWRMASRPNSDLFGLVRGDAYGFQSEYLTIDARLAWQASKAIELGFGVDNLFNNKAYVAHPLPQRSFVFDLKSKW
jgi:iron complex outermembrane recepter protein